MAFRQALAFMFERERPWSVILFSSAHDATVFREFEWVMSATNPTKISNFFGFEVLLYDSKTTIVGNHCLEIASYENLHTYLTAHANVSLQQSVLAVLPKPWFQRFFQERQQETNTKLKSIELASSNNLITRRNDFRVT